MPEIQMKSSFFRTRWWHISGIVLLLNAVSLGQAQEKESPTELAMRLDQLIRELDDEAFEVREQAQAQLAKIGERALAKLTAAAKDSSAERRQRAARIVKQIKAEKRDRTISAPIEYGNMMLILVSDEGVGAVVFSPESNHDATY